MLTISAVLSTKADGGGGQTLDSLIRSACYRSVTPLLPHLLPLKPQLSLGKMGFVTVLPLKTGTGGGMPRYRPLRLSIGHFRPRPRPRARNRSGTSLLLSFSSL